PATRGEAPQRIGIELFDSEALFLDVLDPHERLGLLPLVLPQVCREVLQLLGLLGFQQLNVLALRLCLLPTQLIALSSSPLGLLAELSGGTGLYVKKQIPIGAQRVRFRLQLFLAVDE